MSIPTKPPASGDIMEQVIIKGDLSKLSAEERVRYYNEVCKSIGLNPLTRPFEYITLNGKLQLYALRACADQLRQIKGVSLNIVSRDLSDGILTIHVRASLPDGRCDEDLGAVALPDTLKGEARANAELKCITKAKRRATLSICGLGWLDETEVESIPGAKKPPAPAPNVMKAPKVHPVPDAATQREAMSASHGSMKELAASAKEAAEHGREAFKIFWRPLTDSQKSMLSDMGDELAAIMARTHNPVTGELPEAVEPEESEHQPSPP